MMRASDNVVVNHCSGRQNRDTWSWQHECWQVSSLFVCPPAKCQPAAAAAARQLDTDSCVLNVTVSGKTKASKAQCWFKKRKDTKWEQEMNRRDIIVWIKTSPEDTTMIDVIPELWRKAAVGTGWTKRWCYTSALIHSCLFPDRVCCVFLTTHQFVHEIWVGAGGEQLSAGQGLVDKRIVLKGIPKGRLHPTDAGLGGETPLSRLSYKFTSCVVFFFFLLE